VLGVKALKVLGGCAFTVLLGFASNVLGVKSVPGCSE
jgi:hypothetical protein